MNKIAIDGAVVEGADFSADGKIILGDRVLSIPQFEQELTQDIAYKFEVVHIEPTDERRRKMFEVVASKVKYLPLVQR
jgi:hypothetical protein